MMLVRLGRTGAGEAAARRAPAGDGAGSPPHRHTQDQAVRPWLAQGDAGQSSSLILDKNDIGTSSQVPYTFNWTFGKNYQFKVLSNG